MGFKVYVYTDDGTLILSGRANTIMEALARTLDDCTHRLQVSGEIEDNEDTPFHEASRILRKYA